MKHAYLIAAHNNFAHLQRLIRLLDDKDTYFFVHIDKKSSVPDSLRKMKTTNPLTVLNEYKVEWGDSSIVKMELALFQESLKVKEIEWFHLISGNDFPLKPAAEIRSFYDNATDVDCFMEHEPFPSSMEYRNELYHLYIRRRSDSKGFLMWFNDKLNALQSLIGVKRKPIEGLPYRYGSNWVDLRRRAVELLVDRRQRIMRKIRFTLIPDEMYIQTFLQNDGLRVVNDNRRYIDWSEGKPSPKSLEEDDYKAVMSSGKLFARKFDTPQSEKLADLILSPSSPILD
ncbi:MAG: beta-1,6-N-acetylglucosaminyltransferase [Bacteroidales bacterium]|nr:beta-1,6-N-acetylglucosaminyltransferase [Bacteroidales bacterium]